MLEALAADAVPHRDDHVGSAQDLVAGRAREGLRCVHAQLGDHRPHAWIDLTPAAVPADWTRTRPSESSVVNADATCPRPPPLTRTNTTSRRSVGEGGCDWPGPEPLAREPMHEQRTKVADRSRWRKPLGESWTPAGSGLRRTSLELGHRLRDVATSLCCMSASTTTISASVPRSSAPVAKRSLSMKERWRRVNGRAGRRAAPCRSAGRRPRCRRRGRTHVRARPAAGARRRACHRGRRARWRRPARR